MIESISANVQRAEVDTDVVLTATVRDTETAVNQLIFEWAADAGTFTGQGPTVTWRAPDNANTPADFVIRLTVREQYGTAPAGGQRPEHRVTGNSGSIRIHNSPKELGDMAMRFLNDFANSSITATTCVREFADSCPGKAEERAEIETNRRDYDILSSTLRVREVSVSSDRMSGNMRLNCAFSSRVKTCAPDTNIKDCSVGRVDIVDGDCLLTAVYEQNRWWLCRSNFVGVLVPSMKSFFGAPK